MYQHYGRHKDIVNRKVRQHCKRLNELVQERLGVPTLHLETDYSESDTEQLRVRIEAYIEML